MRSKSASELSAKKSAHARDQNGPLVITARLYRACPIFDDADVLNELLGQRVGLRRLRATGRAGKLDLLLAIGDFNCAYAHELLAGRADPNGRGR